MTDDRAVPRRSTRALLVLGILAGFNSGGVVALSQPEQLSLATDVYFHAATAVLEGGDLYATTPPGLADYHYIYPPIVVVLFVPHALLGSETAAFALQTGINVAAGIGVGLVLRRALARRGIALGRIDSLLVVGFALCSAWSAAQLVMGQVNLVLALAISLGLDRLDREHDVAGSDDAIDAGTDDPGTAAGDAETTAGRSSGSADAEWAGVAFALAALVKLFPAVLGLWLLRTRRYRAVGAAIATGLGGLVLGVLVLGPDLTVEYLTEVLAERFEGQTFEGTPDPERNHTTARRMLAAAFGGSSPIVTPLALAIVVPPVAYCYRTVASDQRRLAAVLATLVGTFLVMPLQPLYFSFLLFPAVLLAFTLDAGLARKLLIAGMFLTFTFAGPGTARTVAGPLPDALGNTLVEAATDLFTYILPPTVGMWLLLAACVAMHAGTTERRSREQPGTTAST